MKFLSIYCVFVAIPLAIEGNTVTKPDDKHHDKYNPTTKISTTTPVPYFSEMPENIIIKYIEALSLIEADNKGERMMGVSDEKCDNAKVGNI